MLLPKPALVPRATASMCSMAPPGSAGIAAVTTCSCDEGLGAVPAGARFDTSRRGLGSHRRSRRQRGLRPLLLRSLRWESRAVAKFCGTVCSAILDCFLVLLHIAAYKQRSTPQRKRLATAVGTQTNRQCSPPRVGLNRRAPRRSRRNFCVKTSCRALVRQRNHLPASAAHRKMLEYLAALPLAQRLLGKCAQALRIGMKIVLCRCVHCAACSWNVSVCEFCSSFFRFMFRSRGSAPSASCAARRLRPLRLQIPENLLPDLAGRAPQLAAHRGFMHAQHCPQSA